MKTQLMLDFETKPKRKRKKEYRYRDEYGSTSHSTQAVERHLHKIGVPKFVRGYMYRDKGRIRVRVMIHGTQGTARFCGFAWGFSGEGPRGLIAFLGKLGIDKALAQETVYKTPWVEEFREHWRIEWTTTLRRAA